MTKRSAKTLCLRTCAADMTSYNGFVWPESGAVECPDWNPEPVCGGGLHALAWGCGDSSVLNWSEDARWLVVEVEASTIVDIAGKVKFPRGSVVFCGAREGAVAYLDAHGAADKPVVTAARTAGYMGSATAGYRGSATAGDRGSATAGDMGSATAGYRGSATAGYRGSATAGHMGSATAGAEGVLVIQRWNGKRYRWEVANVGEDGIQPNVRYTLDGDGKFVPATEPMHATGPAAAL